LRDEAVLGELVAEAGNGEDGLLAVDDPEIHRHQARVLPALREAEVGVERAVLPHAHLGEELLAHLGDLAVLQLFVEPAALLEPAALDVVLPAHFREPLLEDALAARAVQGEQLDIQWMPLAHAVGLAVLQRLDVRAVAAAVGPDAVSRKVGGDEDGLAGVGDEPVHFAHVGGEGARFAGSEVVEDGAQLASELLAVLDRQDREQGTEAREPQTEELERGFVEPVPAVGRPQNVEQHCALLPGSLAISRGEADVCRGRADVSRGGAG